MILTEYRAYDRIDGHQEMARVGRKITLPDGRRVVVPATACPQNLFGVTLRNVYAPAQSAENLEWSGQLIRDEEDLVQLWTEKGLPNGMQIRAEAEKRILAFCPEWKQRNLTARAAEFALKLGHGDALSGDELEEWQIGQAIWTHIKAIRTASDVLEANPVHGYQQDIWWPLVEADNVGE